MTGLRDQRYRETLNFADHIRGGTVAPIFSGGTVAYADAGRYVVVDRATGDRRVVDRAPAPDVPAGRQVRQAFKIGRPPVVEVAGPGGEFFATETGDDLAVRWAVDGRTTPLTSNGEPGFRWDVKGARWSPDGIRLLARRIDTRHLPQFPVVHWLKPLEEVEFFPTGRVGGDVEEASLYVLSRLSSRVVGVDSGPQREQDLRPLGWAPDGRRAYFLRTDRFKSAFALMSVDPDSGVSRTVFEERPATWVSYWEKGLGCELLPSGAGHLWLSERDGWAHLYLHDMDGALVRRLTSGPWPVTRIVTVDEPAGWVYFEAHIDQDRPYDTHICRVRLDGSDLQQLTSEPGSHTAQMSPDARLLVDSHMSMDRPPATDLRAADGTPIARLASGGLAEPSFGSWRPPDEFTVTAADGVTTLHGQLYLPSDFDPANRYPVIESIYAGPNSAFVPTRMTDPNAVQSRALAELGFAVVMVDARGTPERSKEFHDVAFRNFADNVIADHVTALQQLGARHRYLDLSRVGVYGRSYGGYFTARALLEAPDTYHVGVAVNGVYEMRDSAGPGPIECVMGPMEQNLDGYDALSLYPMIDRLRGKLLIVHGTSDVNVPFSASLRFVEALTLADKPFDFLPVNEQPHHFVGAHGRYLSMAMARYFCEHLGVEAL
jgi:dipeptidyl aminopeptidase/acylaminoacyl peptidase